MAKPKKIKKAKAPKPFASIAKALLTLSPTREGFEGLVTELIEATAEGRLALMSSGDQAGVDSIGGRSGHAPRRAMQAKRYADSTGLDQNHLLGEMDRAQSRFEFVDCWILASTKTVFGKEREDLEAHAERLGWGLVVVDWTLIGGLPRLAALCAAHRGITDRYITSAPAHVELDAIAADPAFGDVLRQLKHDLQAADVGFEPAREAAAAQMERVFSDRYAARKLAGASPTFLSQAPPVPRPALNAAIRAWWDGDQLALALLGDEGMGKTWAGLSTLRPLGAEAGGPLVVVIPSPMASRTTDGLEALVEGLVEAARNAGWSTTQPEGFWRRRLNIWARNRFGRCEPRILVFIDGLDELDPFDWNSWLAPLLDDSLGGLVRVILACRNDDWIRGARPSDLDKASLTEFGVGLFEPEERDAFLKSMAIDIAKVSKPVLDAALHPRTAFHVVRLGAEIGDLTRITREQILLRDFSNRFELKGGTLAPEAFEQVVIQMARDAEAAVLSQEEYRAQSGQIVDLAVQATGHAHAPMRRILSEMVSGGWVQRDAVSPLILTFTDKALPLAVGMALAEAIQAKTLDKALVEVERLLEPWGADDLVEPVLRTCATVLVTRGAPDPLCRDILRRWAALRFHSNDAQDFWRRLHAFKPELFLEMVELGLTGSNWLGEWGVASLWEDQPGCMALVEARLQHWLTRIGLPRHQSRADKSQEAVTNRERNRQLRRVKALEDHGGAGWRNLIGCEIEPRVAPFHRAVRTIGLLPRAAFVPGLVGWAVASAASGRRYGLTEVSALLRDNPFDWAETISAVSSAVEALIALDTGLGRTAASLLLDATGRPEDAARSLEVRPRSPGWRDRALFRVIDRKIVFNRNELPIHDSILLTCLVEYAPDPSLDLSPDVRARFDEVMSALPTDRTSGWLTGERPRITPLLRWSRAKTLTLIKEFIAAGPTSADAGAKGGDYAVTAAVAFPILSTSEASDAADLMETGAGAPDQTVVTALRLLPLSFSEQLNYLTSRPSEDWPDGVEALLKPPRENAYVAVVRSLDGDAPTEAIKLRLHLLSKVKEHRRPGGVIDDVDWPRLFAHEDAGVRTLSLDLADTTGGEAAARALVALNWTSEDHEPIAAYEGSAVLGALSDAELEPLVPRLSGENALRVMHQRAALRQAAETRIWRWIADALEVARTSHSMGATFCHYVPRDEAFAEFVDRNAERVHQTLDRVWNDKRLRSNLLFDDGDSPGWPLLKALASHQPDFVKNLWRDAVKRERGFSFSSINTFPTDLPPGPLFDDVRLEMLEDIHTDDRLSRVVQQLQSDGHYEFLRDLIADRFNSARPYDRAWALVVAGFLVPTDETEALWRTDFAASPGPGWLATVYAAARTSFAAASNARYWFRRIGAADNEADAWSALRLMLLSVDERYIAIMREGPFMFEGKDERVRWLNFLAPEEREARKRSTKALSNSWLRGPRYQDVINGR